MALLNLAVNARDAMPDGGQLRIGVTCDSMAADNRLRLREGRYVRLSVADTGIGMDQQTAEKAIEPFFTTKGVGQGRSEEHTSELQSLMRNSYAVFCLKKKITPIYA